MAKKLKVSGMSRCIGCLTCMNMCAAYNEQSHSINKSAIHIKTTGGLQGRFVANVCNACTGERPCASVCPSGALKERKGGGVLLDSQKCLGCGKCVDACAINAVHFDTVNKRPIICKHCGICAKYCPHDCLEMEEVEND